MSKHQPLRNFGKDFDVHDYDDEKNLEPQFSGKIKDLDKIQDPETKKSRRRVQTIVAYTFCGAFIFIMLWGAINGDWEPWKQCSSLISGAFGFMVRHLFG